MANTFLNEIVYKCTHGIDIHSGAIHRTNFPQIRLELDDEEGMRLARAFGAPVILHSPQRAGTLRKAAQEKGIKTLLFEGGEALRFDEHSISVAVHGVLNVMREIDMLPKEDDMVPPYTVITAKSSHWIRAQTSGSLRFLKKIGEFVQADELLGVISDPFGKRKSEVKAIKSGVIIGVTTMPLVNKGSALFHVATLEDMTLGEDKADTNIVLDQDIDIENEDWFVRS
jgi:predicted deacylase